MLADNIHTDRNGGSRLGRPLQRQPSVGNPPVSTYYDVFCPFLYPLAPVRGSR